MGVRIVRRLTAVPALLLIAGCNQADSAAAPPAIRYDQHIEVEGVSPVGAQLTNPLSNDKRAAADGEKLFTSMNCDGCHGGGATGAVGPSLSDGRWRYGGSDGAIYQTIVYGRPRGMPAYGGVLQQQTVWKLVTYLKSLPLPAAIPTQSW
jgi:cytochrome c oxidase cbb3-type subunit 3